MHKFLELVLVLLPLLGCLRTGNQAFGQFDAVQDVFLGEALTVGESALTICLAACSSVSAAFFSRNLPREFTVFLATEA